MGKQTDHISTNQWKEMELGQRIINILMDMNFKTERIHIHLLTIRQILIQNEECKHSPWNDCGVKRNKTGDRTASAKRGWVNFAP